MARAETETLLSIDQWARIMGLSLWEINQFGAGFPEGTQEDGSCSDVTYQYEWQRDHLAREEIARTIAKAELMVADWLGFYPAPKYITGEQLNTFSERGYAFRYGARLLTWHRTGTNYRKVTAFGSLARTLIDNVAAVTASDPDGDNVNELFTVTVTTSVTDTNEIGVYLSSGDRLGESVSEKWRIRPVNVSISGGTATITGHRALLAKPTKTNIVNPLSLDVTDNANYVTTVAVYRIYTDTTAQGTAYWNYTATDTITQPSTATSHSLKFSDDNQALGQIFVTWDDDGTASGYRAPDRVLANYVSGIPLVNGDMSPDYQQIIAYLATGILADNKCGCERSAQIIAYWKRDITESINTSDTGRPPTPIEQDCPFGYTRGALWAWQRLRKKQEYNVYVI